MAQKQLATKVDEHVKDALDALCESRGLKIGHFVQEAILDKIEELEDLDDLKKLRVESSVSLEKIIEELKKVGKL
jgi:predicted DNA-binding protein